MRNIHVTYNDIHALKGIDFDLYRGEVHALIGEHRAGKTSLAKVLSGAVQKKEGEIIFDGKSFTNFTTRTSTLHGIGMMYQDLNIIPNLDAVKNIFAGQMIISHLGFIDYAKMMRSTLALFEKLNLRFDPRIPMYKLSLCQQYMVELARIWMLDPGLIIFDEVSNKLTPDEMVPIYRIISEKKQSGGSIIYITHNMDEVLQLADRVTILKDGYRRGTEVVKDLDKYRLFELTYSFASSKKKLGEDARRFSVIRNYIESVIQHLPIGVIVLDLKDRVQLVNFAALELLKLGHRSLIKVPLSRILVGINHKVLAQIRQKLRSMEEGSWDDVSLGEKARVNITVVRFRDSDFGFFGNTILIQDVSVDHYLKSYFARSEKMASVAEVAVGVAHEINNPLYIIKNTFELIEGEPLGPAVRERLTDIEKEVDRIVKIVNSLLSFSRIAEQPKKRINIAVLLEEVLLLLHHSLSQKNIRLNKKTGDFDAEIVGDENRLTQLLINLINNSIEAMLDEGILEAVILTEKKEGRVKVIISDNGYGIPGNIHDRIFKPFFSTKINKRNAGLGLSICQQIVKEHGGEISFKSIPGEKTSFCVTFPLA
ncbi:MAG: ATP-binding protein [Spirochaetia bacterium]|jgi:two-component system sensor histidine kinase AtoS